MQTSVSLCGVTLKNPIITASGTFGFGREYAEFYPLDKLGGISTKGLTLLPREGNPTPRIAETPSGILNAVGLQNPGVEAFIREDLPWLKQQGTVIFANAAGACESDYEKMAERLDGLVEFIELNISCPNVKAGGIAFGVYPESIYNITRLVKAKCPHTPLVVKLSPNVANIAENARMAEKGGADAISLVNTFTGMAVDARRRRPILANRTGGLSGPCIKPLALRMVYDATQAVDIPVIGMGGIMTGEDVVEFLLCGATAVQVGTANISDPMAAARIADELCAFMQEQGISSVQELIGALKV